MKTKESGTYESKDGVQFITKDFIIEHKMSQYIKFEGLLKKIGEDKEFFDGKAKENKDKIFEWNPEYIEVYENTVYTIIRESTLESRFPYLYVAKLDLEKLYNGNSPIFEINGKTYYGELVKRISTKEESVVMWHGQKLRPDIGSYKRDGVIQFTVPIKLTDKTITRYVMVNPENDEVKIYDSLRSGAEVIYENGAFIKGLL